MPKTDFFISYAGEDQRWADWIAWTLREAGYLTLHQSWNFRPGSNFIASMKDALEASERTIAIYSPAYFRSSFSEDEWSAAFADRALIPVRVSACEIPKLLRPVVYIDIVGLDEQTAYDTLLAGINHRESVPLTSPVFPTNDDGARQRFPGSLPNIFEVPSRRNSNFTGRDQLLEGLYGQLGSGGKVSVSAVSGLGGVGKTSLALEYCYRFASEYELIWWMRAEEPLMLLSDYARLAGRLHLIEATSHNQNEVVAAVKRWLNHHRGWLLVFDNGLDVDMIEALLPHGDTGHVLITSRNQIWRQLTAPLVVGNFSREESTAFLQKRTGHLAVTGLDDLCDLVGDLPIAVEHAAAYIEATAISIPRYLSRLQEFPEPFLRPLEVIWTFRWRD